ncbi:TIGR03986 family CRISPR-associated RAMP protein [Thermoleptolyngbya sichuanensis XZ-Cy5]|uniref:TIGR03986 family type III CRISPR-associated RAMP protein n=1 Tax=Thermoleptolyngbya sichuanensis TaxID=2885951 RepID=UPI00240D3D96|nr:TIGR03986 family CRISPR-associated RAMP protein [Thermoleptolyngbya sichuanensis]MDG2618056.1 TIGR03986 family CRISPR-associated RAMP protein [Thermoleptolyngbya sichuanensis XZ-Cy5]
MTNNKLTQIQRPNHPQRPNPSNAGNQTKKQSPPLKKQDRPQNKQRSQNSDSRQVFHNPYNFVPATPRQNIKGELGDRAPRGHGQYLDDRWSGRIRVNLTTVTPLLIPDAAQAEKWQNSEHKTYPIRLINGRPYLSPTSIKGSLRSAYEVITNSRLSIFQKHNDHLAYRMEPTPKIFPAIVTEDKRSGKLVLRLMQAAKILCYKKYEETEEAPIDKGASEIIRENNYPENRLPRHTETIWFQLNRNSFKVIRFRFDEPEESEKGWQKGWACITGPNCNEKRYERVFFERSPDNQKSYEITEQEVTAWEKLIKDYQDLHEEDLKERKKEDSPKDSCSAYLGHEPGQTGWSKHVYTKSIAELKRNTFCYAQIQNDKITALLPVMVSRQLFKTVPEALLEESLKPSEKMDTLSPADRVFGWVNQKGKGAYKGQLRLHSVKCLSTDAIQKFTKDPANNPGLPLTILGQPKPQQFRFYVAKNKQGDALDNGTPKQDGYASAKQGLRGRKVYPHHKAIAKNADYWDDPMRDRTEQSVNGYYQEYRRPKKDGAEQRDSQNRSIQAWVKQNTQFQFDIDITNLSPVELGALLWLLELPDDHYHRLGGGKPLGFGSVQLKIDWSQTDLRLGQAWKQYYESLLPIDPPDPGQATECVDAFKQAVALAYSPKKNTEDFEEVLFIKAFKQAAKGLDGPVHYPRMKPQPDPDGENYKWFTENESGEKRSLPPLWNETGLPYWE